MNGLQLVKPLRRQIGQLPIERVLPTVRKRTLGPFVFLDHVGPHIAPSRHFHVPPHPHIGLSTVTYLFEGDLRHRDSVGSDQRIEPGAVNWMMAGQGVVHSERPFEKEPDDLHSLHGLQAWVALPKQMEASAPSFAHYASEVIPVLRKGEVEVRLLAGTGFGMVSPVSVTSPLIYAIATLRQGARLVVPQEHGEQGIYLVSGEAEIRGATEGGAIRLCDSVLCMPESGLTVEVVAKETTRLAIVGGEPLGERRYLDWNFCASDKKLIEDAKEKYRSCELGVIDGEVEQLPLPEDVE